MRDRHEIPTHLAVDDQLLMGLTAGQVLVVLTGWTVLLVLWQRTDGLPTTVRVVGIGCLAVAVVVLAALRPQGRGLAAWSLLLLRYWALPKVSIWRPWDAARQESQTALELVPHTPTLAWAGTAAKGGGQ